MNTTIILSTRNQSKVEQIKPIFFGLRVHILSLDDAKIEGKAIENGETLEENAMKKAWFAWECDRAWYMAEDTGLFIDALDGMPGVHSARWAGEEATTEDIMRFTLEKLKDVPPPQRTASFKTVAVLLSPDGSLFKFSGEVRGSILGAPRCACKPDMPYSAIFLPDGQSKVWAEMSVEEVNAISHRGKAFRQVREFLADSLR